MLSFYIYLWWGVSVLGVSVQRGVSAREGVSVQGGLCTGGLFPEGLCPGESLSRGLCPRGVYVQGPLFRGISVTETTPYDGRAGGMHPTGMHSNVLVISRKLKIEWNNRVNISLRNTLESSMNHIIDARKACMF